MRNALANNHSGFILKQSLPHQYRTGTTEVYEAIGSPTPNIAAVRNFGLPAKVTNLSKLQ
jgi:hypothetical protein